MPVVPLGCTHDQGRRLTCVGQSYQYRPRRTQPRPHVHILPIHASPNSYTTFLRSVLPRALPPCTTIHTTTSPRPSGAPGPRPHADPYKSSTSEAGPQRTSTTTRTMRAHLVPPIPRANEKVRHLRARLPMGPNTEHGRHPLQGANRRHRGPSHEDPEVHGAPTPRVLRVPSTGLQAPIAAAYSGHREVNALRSEDFARLVRAWPVVCRRLSPCRRSRPREALPFPGARSIDWGSGVAKQP